MTNIEKYKEELTRFALADGGFAVIDGKPTLCSGASCGSCLFNLSDGCEKERLKWLDEEYTEDNTCKTCIHFHLAEGLIRTGVCGLMEFEVARADETCGEYKRRQNK